MPSKQLSHYQMVAHAKSLYKEVVKVYDDIKFNIIDGMPTISMPEGNYMGMSVIRVLENLHEEIEFYNDNEEEVDDEEE